MKNAKIYAFIHSFMNNRLSISVDAVLFFFFFSGAAIFEVIMSRLILHLADAGVYSFHAAARFAPIMVNSALLSVVLAVGGAVVIDLLAHENKTNAD